ncbi:DUF3263 domain-containing protein [Agromyces seonyuensis]|uniref:DUF3263 domain-containing protein n=1 Tax=Agromyces seonyuensis TaxID=2662446 RepID=A0A6I4NTK5_9MICO|nr:DUF3263 domain-containing protein [Agromyces seonyuensis]
MDRSEPRTAVPPAVAAGPGLAESDRRLLGFEAREWPHPGVKEEAMRVELGLSAARYYQRLGALLDEPEALRADPLLVRRLQRLRDAREAARRRRIPPAVAG